MLRVWRDAKEALIVFLFIFLTATFGELFGRGIKLDSSFFLCTIPVIKKQKCEEITDENAVEETNGRVQTIVNCKSLTDPKITEEENAWRLGNFMQRNYPKKVKQVAAQLRSAFLSGERLVPRQERFRNLRKSSHSLCG